MRWLLLGSILGNTYSRSPFALAGIKQCKSVVNVDVLLFCRSAIRNWLFQVSKDSENWTTIKTHDDDKSLNEPG